MEVKNETLTFREAFDQLQKIVEQLESDSVELEQALALYEKGVQLSQYCAGLLEQAELKIQQVSQPQTEQQEPDSDVF
jgi:exodeoxyribonuclease VII small subunit